MSTEGGVMKMRPVENGLTIEPGKTVKLAPGGYHLMMMDLKQPLKRGDKVPLTAAGDIGRAADQPVRALPLFSMVK
jgi:copper(I)-binding protein